MNNISLASVALRYQTSSPVLMTAKPGYSKSLVRLFNNHITESARKLLNDHQRTMSMYIWRMRRLNAVAQRLSENINRHMVMLSCLFARQFNAIAAQRLRRSGQIFVLYRNLGYDKHLLKTIVERFVQVLRKRFVNNKSLSFLLAATLFSWDKHQICEEEIQRVSDEISYVEHCEEGLPRVTREMEGWEKIIDKKHLVAWRKPIENSYLYEYKIFGRYDDLSARAFYNAQVDLEFRKQWDRLVIKLDIVDKQLENDTELIHWVMHYPYPMYSREYLYVRRCKIDSEKKLMIIINRGIDCPAFPEDKNLVRVTTYCSNLVIKPHKNFDENGFDYVLTYFDDPKSSFPSVAYNWMATTGVPDFVDKVHKAAKLLHERKQKKALEDIETEALTKDKVPM